jgi:hypothetical protein
VLGQAHTTAANVGRLEAEGVGVGVEGIDWGVGTGGWMRSRGCGVGGESEEALDELRAAGGDESELGGVVAVLGAEDAGDAEKVAVEAESAEEIAGVVSQTRILSDAVLGRSVFA